ncbi:MAG: helix-turn-helix domain-containing protein [Gammaproteobacteria bacterium]
MATSNDPESIALGQRLRELADRVGGKKEMARLGGISEVQIYRYINGENVPSIRAIARLAEAADVSLNWLATGEGPQDRQTADRPSGSDKLDFELLRHLLVGVLASVEMNSLTAEKRAEIVADIYAQVVSKEEQPDARLRLADAILSTVTRLVV